MIHAKVIVMKISKSKKELARIINENGGWRDGEFAAQDGDGSVGGYDVKPEWNSLSKYWWRAALGEWLFDYMWQLQTFVSCSFISIY